MYIPLIVVSTFLTMCCSLLFAAMDILKACPFLSPDHQLKESPMFIMERTTCLMVSWATSILGSIRMCGILKMRESLNLQRKKKKLRWGLWNTSDKDDHLQRHVPICIAILRSNITSNNLWAYVKFYWVKCIKSAPVTDIRNLRS